MLLLRTHVPRGQHVAESIRDRIKSLRKKEKLTLDQLAVQAGLSKSYLWELENKEVPRPSGEKLAGLAKALNVTVDYLLGGDPAENLEGQRTRHSSVNMKPCRRKPALSCEIGRASCRERV